MRNHQRLHVVTPRKASILRFSRHLRATVGMAGKADVDPAAIIHVKEFANNQPAIRAYSKLGFVCTFETIGNAKAAAIFPCDVKYKMTRK